MTITKIDNESDFREFKGNQEDTLNGRWIISPDSYPCLAVWEVHFVDRLVKLSYVYVYPWHFKSSK